MAGVDAASRASALLEHPIPVTASQWDQYRRDLCAVYGLPPNRTMPELIDYARDHVAFTTSLINEAAVARRELNRERMRHDPRWQNYLGRQVNAPTKPTDHCERPRKEQS